MLQGLMNRVAGPSGLRRAIRLRGDRCIQGNGLWGQARSRRAEEGYGARPGAADRYHPGDRTVAMGAQHPRLIGDPARAGSAPRVGDRAERHDLRPHERDRPHDGHPARRHRRVRTRSDGRADQIWAGSCQSTRTARKKPGRQAIQRSPSGDSPPAGTMQWRWGWCWSAWPQV